MAIITISREFGSVGKKLGQLLAESLGYEYIDRRKIIRDMSAIDKQWGKLGEEFDEHSPNIWERYDWSFQGFVALTQSIILNYGLKDKVVLMGRGGNFLFKDVPYALRIRITMPREARILRIMKEEDFTRTTACWLVKKADKEMAKAVYLIYGKHWDDPEEYDMTFDLEVKKEKEFLKMISKALPKKEKFNTEKNRDTLRIQAVAAKVNAGIATNPIFLLPTLEVKAVGDKIVVHAIVHNPNEEEQIVKEAKKLAGNVPIDFDLHYRGILRTIRE